MTVKVRTVDPESASEGLEEIEVCVGLCYAAEMDLPVCT